MRPAMLLLLSLAACTGTGPQMVTAEDGMLGMGPLNPFPNSLLIGADGHLALTPDAFPLPVSPIDGTALTKLPVDGLSWRTGFSSGQTSYVVLEGVNADELPDWRSPTPGVGGVFMLDMATGDPVPVMAELDAWCALNEADLACDGLTPALLVRPLVALTRGHRYAVVVTTDVAPRPAFYDNVVQGDAEGEVVDVQRALHVTLQGLGVNVDTIAVAWDFPVVDGGEPLRSALSQVTTPVSWNWTVTRTSDDGDPLPPGIWKHYEGKITVSDFLVEDLLLDSNGDGTVNRIGEVEAFFSISVPESVRDQPAGTVPIMIFGHGLFGHPRAYLADEDDPSGVAALISELGVITVATTMRGLEQGDRVEALLTAGDFGRFPLVPDRVVQGQVATRAILMALKEGELVNDGVFEGGDGQALSTGQDIVYYGISLGGIEGQVLAAQGYGITAAALHVPGGMWSTMLERSTQWSPFEIVITGSLPNPNDRQLCYAVSQLWWDPVDPVNWIPEMQDKTLLFQESIGDEQVANITTRMLVRSLGIPVLAPAADLPWGMESAPPPLGPQISAMTQFDPMVGVPDNVNRPAGNTRAHSLPRNYQGAREQVVSFLTPGQRGTVTHPCGDAPCSAQNQGTTASE